MNVFGGGCRGNVNGTTHVKYLGNENTSYVLGSIYGGGLYGAVGVSGETPVATDVRLYSGNVDKVYGGSCLGDLYGRTNVELCDEVTTELEYFDYNQLLHNDDIFDWGGSRLIVGYVFGGNDVAGHIYPQPLAPTDPAYDEKDEFATYVLTYEVAPDPALGGHSEGEGPGKETPGSVGDYNGYPLIGRLFAGSNGNYGYHKKVGAKDMYVTDDEGNPSIITFATGEGNSVMKLKLSGDDSPEAAYEAFEIPNVTRSRIDIKGGTIVNAYGGGDRATITENTVINVQYQHDTDIMDARAGFVSEAEFVRTWNTFHLAHSDQIDDVTYMLKNASGGSNRVFKHHIYRLFGGNDKATMAIQPTWNLESGHLGNVYSGGNFGEMTYFSRDAEDKPVGLSLTVNSPHFHAEAIYGGGRVGDIHPAVDATFLANAATYASTPSKENEVHSFYGATLNIKQGVLDHVYGGNDVAGNVKYGTRVNIKGAISGDVYCAGNGNYLYKYDPEYEGTEIEENFHPELGRYFQLPALDEYRGDKAESVDRLLAINHYRPNVDRSYLHIEGYKEGETTYYAYVRGNVYCGGNSSTVGVGLETGTNLDGITFDLGNYVMLNGVFLGSNGENLVDPAMMRAFEELNGINLASKCETVSAADINTYYSAGFTLHDQEVLSKPDLFPNLLDVYLRAVDVYSTPSDFKYDAGGIKECYIGDFYVGGNRGSMLTDQTISLTFPNDLVIFGKIVGGSNNANITYKGVPHIGGLTRPIDSNNDKVYLQILSKFEPWKMTYPAKNAAGETDYRVIKVVPDVEKMADNNLYFSESKCSVFGGCFNSGRTVGNIHIDLYSDLSGEYDPESEIYKQIEELYGIGTGDGDVTKERIIINGIDKLQRRSFALIGGGYGSETSVHGNIRLHMLPGKFHPDFKAGYNENPSAATVFAGSEKGAVIGNTEVTVRDGVVLSNLYGGSESSTLYGSTNIIIGWPQYFVCKKTGKYALDRTDKQSTAARGLVTNAPGSTEPDPVKKNIWLCEGDYVSVNLFRQFAHTQEGGLTYIAPSAAHPYGNFEEDATGEPIFKFVDDDTPENYAAHNNSPYVEFHDITWDDINIYIGNNKSRLNSRAEYYAHGNIYGGGFITANSGTTLAGEYTVRKFDKNHTPDEALIGYGGNSTILIWDNPDNADLNNPVKGRVRKMTAGGVLEAENAGTGPIVRDHITIGTGHYKPVTLLPGQDAMGYYVFKPEASGRYELNGEQGVYVHQSSHIVEDGETTQYFEIESDGGIYGGGRKVYVQGFRNCDLAYYGYADYTPQYPKLLNTAQRLDLFTLTDCCLMMQGAVDFASNSIDATRYSMTRVKELEMRSSINPNSNLSPGQRDATKLANVIHNEPRMRNYLAFFHDVLYVSAMTSSEAFTNPYRGANGNLGYIGNFTKTGIDNADHSVPAGSDYQTLTYDPENPFSYKQYKTNRIGNYYANRNKPSQIDDGSGTMIDNPIKLVTSLEFDQRNVGTAANMIGISNGYTLKVQGAVENPLRHDKVYYGPVNGVFEVKLMTLTTDEGGGYIYALNQHDDPNHYLETTGNFVFPGAAYKKATQDGEEDYNYVHDDCFPMGKGWDSYWGWNQTKADETTSSMGPNLHIDVPVTASVDAGHADCNDPENGGNEVHYWYVNGSNFYFNVTLTAYTYKEPQFFHLNNNEDLIYLYGINGDSEISLESATWSPKSLLNVDGYDSDIQNLDDHPEDYQLFLSIDNEPEKDHTVGSDLGMRPDEANNHAFITRIPRADLAGGITGDALYNSSETINRYNTLASNSPLLGFTLYDKCNNAQKGYYEDHLSKDENVRVELKSVSDGDLTFKYIINLTVKYVKGPTIDGNLQIENDALPGEYIFVNAYGVNIDIDDENMGINARNWYVVGKDCDVSSNTSIQEYLNGIADSSKAAEEMNDQLINSTDLRQVHIPAYRYRDDWNVVYEIVANGLSFYVAPASEKPASAGEDKPFYPRLSVHNYHRMKPMVPMAEHPEDLKLSAGARIYIEDDDDMAYFFEWLGNLQAESCEIGINGGGKINPRYGEGLEVHLMQDVSMPSAVDASTLRFDGAFHGNGHSIDMGNNSCFLGENHGTFYNTGFVSQLVSNEGASAFNTNSGTLECCFFVNATNVAKGKMVGNNATGTVANCYTSSKTDVDAMTFASLNDFRFGRVAYDLNRFYLQERYNRNVVESERNYAIVQPVIDKFLDGEYRYSGVHSDDNPFLLRTTTVPNYRDYLDLRNSATPDQVASGAVLGYSATMHDITDPIDPERVIADAEGNPILSAENKVQYQPIFEKDYLFFGQNLTYGSADRYPHAAITSTRVYRASGFYGSKVDEGFHFNSNVQALHPQLTAVDFSGVRDAQNLGGTYTVGRREFPDQKVWYSPQLDLPNLAECTFDVGSRLKLESGDGIEIPQVTRNLLVYRTEGSYPDATKFTYNTSQPFEQVFCHVIDVPNPADLATTPPNANYVQLVDKEDFNAPIAFDVNQTIWYRRSPAVWANTGDGWEGICLPFTANIAYGSVASREVNSPKNHGLMTHFYGDLDADKPTEGSTDYWTRQTHEYWLRKFTAIDGNTAYFERPASNKDKEVANPQETLYSNYRYLNEYFINAFGSLRYNEPGTEHVPPAYSSTGTYYANYPMLTAHYPYLVSFPGRRFYEFDCTGQFYSERTGDPDPDPQIITFAWDKDKAEAGNSLMHIPVSDESMVNFTHDGCLFVGTFKHCQAEDEDVVIDIEDNASHLKNPTTSEEHEVLPFRAYMQCPGGSPAPLKIGTLGIDTIGEGDDDESKDDSDNENAQMLRIYLNGRSLVIESRYDHQLNLPLCDVVGRVLRVLDVAPGKNRYENFSQGFYLLRNFKFYIP